jgi:lysozyme
MAATRRKYPSKSKKQQIISPKSIKWMVGLFLLLFTIIFVYQKKDAVLYYLGFKINKNELTANQRYCSQSQRKNFRN